MGTELKDEWHSHLREGLMKYMSDSKMEITEAGESIARARKKRVSRSTIGRLYRGLPINTKKAREVESFLSAKGYMQIQ